MTELLNIGKIKGWEGNPDSVCLVYQDQETGGIVIDVLNGSSTPLVYDVHVIDGKIHTLVRGSGGLDPRHIANSLFGEAFTNSLELIIAGAKGLTPHEVGTVGKKHPFEYHKPTDEQVAQITAVREAMKAVYDNLMSLPESRERSIAITKLEEASMWMNKGIIMQ